MTRLRAARLAVALLATLATTLGCSDEPSAPPPGTHVVDLFYLDHAPVRPVVESVDKVLDKYRDKIAVRRHDSEARDSQKLAKELGLGEHLPLAIAIDRTVQFDIDGRSVRFEGFPVGQSPIESAQGGWRLDDLDAALAQRTS